MSFLLNLGKGLVKGAVGGALGLGFGAIQNKQEEKRMQKQFELNKQMAEYNHQLGLDMFRQTGPEAIARQLENAGLSKSLMYNNGSAGGGTVSQGSGEGVSAPNPMGMQIGMQAAQMEANIELTKASADKAKAEAEKISGVDTQKAFSEIDLNKLNGELMKASGEKIYTEMDKIMAEIDIMEQSLRAEIAKADVAEATKEANIEKAFYDMRLSMFAGIEKMTQGQLNEKQTDKVREEIKFIAFDAISNRLKATAADKGANAAKVSAEAADKSSQSYEKFVQTVADKVEGELKKMDVEMTYIEQKNLREWIYGGLDRVTSLIDTVSEFFPPKKVMEIIKQAYNNKTGKMERSYEWRRERRQVKTN